MKERIRVIVQKEMTGDPAWVCYMVKPGYWKCGSCQKGNLGVYPKIGDKCRVCKAVVRQAIVDSPEFHEIKRCCGMCSQPIPEDMKIEEHYKLDCLESLTPSVEQRLRAIEEVLGL